ncbi:MAG: CoA transferase, partial [Chloroflexi bacterium]|nr:CoA transferase [Chloroflexota bacterium]
RIVELAAGLAVAYAGKLLAQAGAEVIRIESPLGDGIRLQGPFPNDEQDVDAGGFHSYLNGGKRSVALNVETQEGADLAAKLIGASDLLLTSWKLPSALPLDDAEAMQERFPDTIYVSISPFGRTGPYAEYHDADSHVLEALAGFSYVTGEPDREPVSIGVEVADYFGGVYGSISALAVLNAREAGETHHFVDISSYESTALTDDHNMAIYEGMGVLRRRFYSRVLGAYPTDIMQAKDGYVSVVPGAPDFATACALLIDRPELIDDPLLQIPKERVVRWRDFDALIKPWLLEHTVDEILIKAQELRLAFAPVPDVKDLLEDEHLRSRGFFPIVDGRQQIGPPSILSETPLRVLSPPALGADNIELLDVTEEENSALLQGGN